MNRGYSTLNINIIVVLIISVLFSIYLITTNFIDNYLNVKEEEYVTDVNLSNSELEAAIGKATDLYVDNLKSVEDGFSGYIPADFLVEYGYLDLDSVYNRKDECTGYGYYYISNGNINTSSYIKCSDYQTPGYKEIF